MIRVHSEEEVRCAFHGAPPTHVRLVAYLESTQQLNALYACARQLGATVTSLKPKSTPPCRATLTLETARLDDLLRACTCAIELDEAAGLG